VAWQPIVGPVEVRHQDTSESLEQLTKEVPFTIRPIHIVDFIYNCDHPDVTALASELDFRLVDMDECARKDLVQEPLVGALVLASEESSEHHDLVVTDVQTE
jgi:hypothetical protein